MAPEPDKSASSCFICSGRSHKNIIRLPPRHDSGILFLLEFITFKYAGLGYIFYLLVFQKHILIHRQLLKKSASVAFGGTGMRHLKHIVLFFTMCTKRRMLALHTFHGR